MGVDGVAPRQGLGRGWRGLGLAPAYCLDKRAEPNVLVTTPHGRGVRGSLITLLATPAIDVRKGLRRTCWKPTIYNGICGEVVYRYIQAERA